MNDHDNTGFKTQPTRYADGDRETIDRIRDNLGDEGFAAFCDGNSMKYRSRAGKKGEAALDAAKADWYDAMAKSVRGLGPDPREGRGEKYTAYQRAGLPVLVNRHRTIQVLDHGFLRFVESWGHGDARMNEAGIIEAARQSTQGNFRGWRSDAKLLRYLYENKHSTPFEFAGLTIEVKAPIFVFRQWHRHRTQSYNEVSGRYTQLPMEWYLPSVERIMDVDSKNKQAGAAEGAGAISENSAAAFREELESLYFEGAALYNAALSRGVPKELARLGAPMAQYTQMRATANLRNWLGFLTLRLDPHAQWEIRQYAEALYRFIREEFPQTAALFDDPSTLG